MEIAEALACGIDVIDARVLLCHVLNVNSAWLVAHANDDLMPASQKQFEAFVKRRVAGEPVAYIVGEREFFGRMFKITPATLIPRPETELLVEFALEQMPAFAHRVLDLGTGSGCIAISIALENSHAQVTAVDASVAALEIAKENARTLNAGSPTSSPRNAGIAFLQSDWFAALNEKFDLIVSNPPYVAEGDAHLNALSYEPASALVAGIDGLNDIRRIVADAPRYLNHDGWLVFEHGYNQGEQSRHLLRNAGFTDVFTRRDLAGHERISGGRCPSQQHG